MPPKKFKRRPVIERDPYQLLAAVVKKLDDGDIINVLEDSEACMDLSADIRDAIATRQGTFHENDPLTPEQYDDQLREFLKQVRINYAALLEATPKRSDKPGNNRLLRHALDITGNQFAPGKRPGK